MKENDTAADMAARHAAEIVAIIQGFQQRAEHKVGGELAAVRRQCSTAIAEACGRHVAEANEHSAKTAKDAAAKAPDTKEPFKAFPVKAEEKS